MADNIIQIEIEIDGKKGFASLNANALAEGAKAGKNIAEGISTSFSSSLSGFKSQLAQIAALVGAGIFTKQAIAASEEQAHAIHDLNQALANSGRLVEGAEESFLRFADTMQKNTILSDDFVIGLQKTAVNFSKTNEEALKLTEAAIQLSAATGIDANTAIEKLGLSLTGVSKGLNIAIPGFTKTSEEALKAGAAVKFVLDKFGGTAESQVNTFGGAVEQTKNKFNELQEALGDIVTKSPEAIAIIKKIGEMLLRAADSVKAFAEGGGFKTLILDTLQFAQVMSQTVVPAIELLKNAFKLFVNFAAGAIQEFLVIPLLSVADAATTVSTALGLTSEATKQTFTDLKEAAILALDDINAKTLESAEQTEEFPLTLQIRNMVTELQNAAQTAPAAAEAIKNGVSAQLEGLQKKGEITAKALNTAFNSSLAGGISSGVQKLTQALIAGQNAFEAFGKAIFGIIGDMAIQLGTFFIAQGIAQLALASNPLTAGGAIVAAGVGLVVLGTLLKSLSGGDSGSTVPSGGGGAGGGVTATSDTEATQFQDQEAAKPATQVVVNVQGNILDRRESGLELVNVLNEYFDTNDGVVARV